MKIISISMIISGKTATMELSPFALSSIVPPLPARAFEDYADAPAFVQYRLLGGMHGSGGADGPVRRNPS